MTAALDLIDARSVDSLAEIPDLTDHYAQALSAVVDAKLHARDLAAPSAPPGRPQLVDLMDALRRSVHDARTSRGENGEPPARS